MPKAGKSRENRQGRAIAALVGESVRLHQRLLAASDRMSRDLGLTGARWQVLSVLGASAEPVTVAAAARWMGLARQSVQRLADTLAADGLIEYLPNPGDQRARLACPTRHGRTLLKQLDERRYEWANRIGADLDADTIEAAVELLSQVRRRLGG